MSRRMSRRALIIADRLVITKIVGLVAPRRLPDAFVFRWTMDGVRRVPYFRWCWHPRAGDLLVGTPHRHLDMIPKDGRRPFGSWLRGFWFEEDWTLAIRPFFWPRHRYDEWSEWHERLDAAVTSAVVKLLRQQISRMRVVTGIDNAWLLSNYGHLADFW